MADKDFSVKQLLADAEEAEAAKDTSKAVGHYSSVIKKDALNENAYNRLMKIFRQAKEYGKELEIINRAIKAYEQFYKSGSKAPSKKVSEISKKLNKSFGLTDKKGNSIYDPEPIARWKKRKITVEKRIK